MKGHSIPLRFLTHLRSPTSQHELGNETPKAHIRLWQTDSFVEHSDATARHRESLAGEFEKWIAVSLSLSPSPSLSLVGVSGFSLGSMARESASGVGLSVGSKTAARRVVPRRLAALLLIPSDAHLGCPVLRGLRAPSFRLLGGFKSRSLEDSWESRARANARLRGLQQRRPDLRRATTCCRPVVCQAIFNNTCRAVVVVHLNEVPACYSSPATLTKL